MGSGMGFLLSQHDFEGLSGTDQRVIHTDEVGVCFDIVVSDGRRLV